MKNNKVEKNKLGDARGVVLHYMQTLVDVARESFLILDAEFKVIAANEVFYQNFQVRAEDTENRFLYALGNGQWNIPELRSLLEEILPKKKVVKNYEVAHDFEVIGRKIILLNARQIDSVQLIILAMEDITTKKDLENKLAEHNKELEAEVVKRTEELNKRVKELETLNKTMIGRELKMVDLKEEIIELKKLIKNSNGNGNGNGKKL